MNTADTGRSGENAAAVYLEDCGYRILSRNYRRTGGEIDIITEKDDVIVFFEIKNWSEFDEMELETIVNAGKRKRIIRTARAFMFERGLGEDRQLRFDIILRDPDQGGINHFEDAFNESGVT